MDRYAGPGAKVTNTASLLQTLQGEVVVEETIRVDQGARDEQDFTEVSTSEDALVEVELEDGTVFWTTVGQLQRDTKDTATRSSELELPRRYPVPAEADRGLVGIAIKTLKFLGYDIAEEIPKAAVEKVVQGVEAQLAGESGFYRIDANGGLTFQPTIEAGTEPVLVFIHGTASSTIGGFGGLLATEDHRVAWQALRERYQGRVYGFEHPTLSAFPAENAVRFLECLPEQNTPPLHLVSHSRGGLVGDLIAHGCLSGKVFPLSMLKATGIPAEQFETYQTFSELLAQKSPLVERFVRVGCPAGGTTLASGRLDICLSLVFNMLSKIPYAGPLLSAVGDLLATTAKLRTDPKVLPGLEAQMPDSAFIRLLNGSGYVLDAGLTVIAGDSDGLLKNLANLYYWGANDLVVDTRSMYRGAQRSRRTWYLAKGPQVHHCNYFERKETVEKLINGLTASSATAGGFIEAEPRSASRGAVLPSEPEDGTDKPAVIVIPGIMGSHLSIPKGRRRNRVWLDISDLMMGNIRHLQADKPDVSADALVGSAYENLAEYLSHSGHHVMAFPYDWRLSIGQAAEQLSQLVERRQQAAPDQSIRLVAHSMGGLVARHFIADCVAAGSEHRPIWDRFCDNDGRLVQLGTPNGGSFLIPYLLTGKEQLLKQLAAIDFSHKLDQWIEIIAAFPGLLEMAPNGLTTTEDFFKQQPWKTIQARTLPTPARLKRAADTVENLLSVDLSAHRVLYVAGKADKTPYLEPGDREFRYTADGDGRVTWHSGIPANVEHWYIDTSHGGLLDHKPSFAGINDLLVKGTTDRLSKDKPPPRVAGSHKPRFGTGDVEIFPTQESLERAALGRELQAPVKAVSIGQASCDVEVILGDLSYAQHPVMVGHYAGDPIIHAEKAVDFIVDGELSRRQRLDLYPGKVGSNEIVLINGADGHIEKGAVVIGLGAAGELTPAGLSATVESAAVRYAVMSRCGDAKLDQGKCLSLSTLFVGSGETGFELDVVIESILKGIVSANRRLARDAESPNRIGQLEFIELYEDRAIQALHVLKALDLSVREGFQVATSLKRRTGGRRRVTYSVNPGWWTPLTIRGNEKEGTLLFNTSARRARVATQELSIQPALVQQLLNNHEAGAGVDPQLQSALFELLLPNHFKQSASDGNHLLLSLDRFAAQIPWEMLVDRHARDDLPLSVRAGFVRKLHVPNPPPVIYSETNCALVVGDPPSRLTELLGAQHEARMVADLFAESNNWEVVRQITGDTRSRKSAGATEIDSKSITLAALNHDFRILHLAGHGVHRPDQPERSGMVIGDHDADPREYVLLSPAEVSQMRTTPELVFINCCHLGRIDPEQQGDETAARHQLAANLAAQFIENGVKAVVAAGWAVDDRAALTFARTFYQQMFQGETFGEAVLRARQATYDSAPDSNTWAAYQCYGDPGFTLVMDTTVRARMTGRRWDDFVDPQEVIAELDNLSGRVKTEMNAAEPEDARRDYLATLESLQQVVNNSGWGEDGRIIAGLARVYAELYEFDIASELYQRAKGLKDGNISLGDLEQLVNLRTRHAAAEARADPARTRASIAAIRQSLRELGKLLAIAPTAERLSLSGSCNKRLAALESQHKRKRKCLIDMTLAYQEALDCRPSEVYAQINMLMGVLMLGGPFKKPAADLAKIETAEIARFEQNLEAALARARSSAAAAESVWDHSYLPDALLTQALYQDNLEQQLDTLVEKYRSLLKRFGSPREQASVVDQLVLAAELLRWAPDGAKANKTREANARYLDQLVKKLG